MSSAALSEARQNESRLRTHLRSIRERSKETMREAIGTGLATMTAVGLGYFKKEYPDAAEAGVLGFPVPLVIGGAGVACSILGVGGAETASYLGNIGTGALCAWGYEAGMGLAEDKKK